MQSAFLCLFSCLFVAQHVGANSAVAQAAVSAGASLAQQTVRIQPAPAGNEVSRTLLTLDANGDGIVSPTEVTAFAMSQGLDARQASQEFQTMDSNADGTLDSKELAVALGTTPTDSVQVAPATPVSTGVALPQQQQQQQLPSSYAAPAPVQLPTEGTQAARATAATAASPSGPAVEKAPLQSFLETRTSAKKAASEVVKQLSLEASEESKAEEFSTRAAELRANASSIARMASEQALKAGAQAAQEMARQLLDKISKLEQQAKEDEVEAAQLRAKSHADITHADQLMAVADSALKR